METFSILDATKEKYDPVVIKCPRTAYTPVLHVLLNHCAEFHFILVKIICKKYGIKEDDMIEAIKNDPEYRNFKTNPLLTSLHP